VTLLDDLRMYARFSWALPGFLRHVTTLDEARAVIRRRLDEREDAFLRLLERGVFGHPRSPYRALMRHAGCEFADAREMVRRRGLEQTLAALRAAGVYVTFEEFKGRTPIIRKGLELRVRADDFNNPHLRRYYEGRSGGSTGPGTRVPIELDQLAARVQQRLLVCEAHGLVGAPTAIWRGLLPEVTGLSNILQGAHMGNVPLRWFTPVTPSQVRQPLRYYLATQHVIRLARLLGVSVPTPEPLRLDQAAVLARWAVATVRASGRSLIKCSPSAAVRIALAALDEGLDLAGVTIMGGGEPATPGKAAQIRRSGARWVPSYAMSEAGHIGGACARPADESDLHFLNDGLALIQHPRPVPGSTVTVDAFYFTTLLPSAPKLMLNTESDDYGVIETRSCGCLLEAYGFTEHFRYIRSFSKLTGHGMTLIGSDMVRILEEVLPARFGGSPLDYQLAEVEDEQGLTRLEIFVDPRVAIADEAGVINLVLESLDAGPRELYRQAGTLKVRRAAPVWTPRAKLLPLHLPRNGGRP
jgi:hypothetical protein